MTDQQFPPDLQAAVDERMAERRRTVQQEQDAAAVEAMHEIMYQLERSTPGMTTPNQRINEIVRAIRDGMVPGVRFAETGITQADADYLVQRLKEAQDSDAALRARCEAAERVIHSAVQRGDNECRRADENAAERVNLVDKIRDMNGEMAALRARCEAVTKAREDDRGRLQQKCSDWGTYWRAPDAHGVKLTTEQAVELLQDALGVEVEIDTGISAAIAAKEMAERERDAGAIAASKALGKRQSEYLYACAERDAAIAANAAEEKEHEALRVKLHDMLHMDREDDDIPKAVGVLIANLEETGKREDAAIAAKERAERERDAARDIMDDRANKVRSAVKTTILVEKERDALQARVEELESKESNYNAGWNAAVNDPKYHAPLKAAQAEVARLRKKITQWISVEERMPEVGTLALVCDENDDSAIDVWYMGEDGWEGKPREDYEITHWCDAVELQKQIEDNPDYSITCRACKHHYYVDGSDG